MDRTELRALQAPLKDRYRADSEAAVTALARLATGVERFCVGGQSLAESPEFVMVRATR